MSRPSSDPNRLATAQLAWTMLGGVVLAVPLTLVLAFVSAMHGDYQVDAAWGRRVVQTWGALLGPLVGVAILPALLAGWLRLIPMRRLLAYCQDLPGRRGRWWAVVGTVVLFELCVVLAALFGWWSEQGQVKALAGWHLLCTVVSLPWLLAAAASTWWVLRTGPPPGYGLHGRGLK